MWQCVVWTEAMVGARRDTSTATLACAHQYCIISGMLNNNNYCICITVRVDLWLGFVCHESSPWPSGRLPPEVALPSHWLSHSLISHNPCPDSSQIVITCLSSPHYYSHHKYNTEQVHRADMDFSFHVPKFWLSCILIPGLLPCFNLLSLLQ